MTAGTVALCLSDTVIWVPDTKSMPKLMPRAPIAIAPTSRIVPDSEKNHRELPMKSKVHERRRSLTPSALGPADQSRAAHRAEDRARRRDRREERHHHADAERQRESLDIGLREDEEDERRHERDDVGVEDRGEPAPVAVDDRVHRRAPGARLLLDAFEDHDVRIRRDADREDQAGDPRQRQRDRDQLDQGEEVERVHGEGDDRDQRRGCGRRRAGTARRPSRPTMPATQPLVERLMTERRRDLLRVDRHQHERQRAARQRVGQRGRLGEGPDVGDLRPVARRDPVGELGEVDRRHGHDLSVERHPEVLEVVRRRTRRRVRPAAVARAPRSGSGRCSRRRP